MRAFEFVGALHHPGRYPSLSLRHIRDRKLQAKKRLKSKIRREQLVPVMYGQGNYHDKYLQRLEREKEQVSLEREKAKLAKEKAQANAAQAKNASASHDRITAMAKSEIGRRKKV